MPCSPPAARAYYPEPGVAVQRLRDRMMPFSVECGRSAPLAYRSASTASLTGTPNARLGSFNPIGPVNGFLTLSDVTQC